MERGGVQLLLSSFIFFLDGAEFVKSPPPLLFLHSQASHRKSSGFSAVSQLFSERWPSTPAGRSFSGATTERNIDFELDVRVEIDSGKCVLHPTTQQAEHEDISLRRYKRKAHFSFSQLLQRALDFISSLTRHFGPKMYPISHSARHRESRSEMKPCVYR